LLVSFYFSQKGRYLLIAPKIFGVQLCFSWGHLVVFLILVDLGKSKTKANELDD